MLQDKSKVVPAGIRSTIHMLMHDNDKRFFSVYKRLPSPSVITCCSPNREAVRAATHYHTRAWQTLIYGKECYIVIVIYLPFKHKQFQIILFNCMQKCPP